MTEGQLMQPSGNCRKSLPILDPCLWGATLIYSSPYAGFSFSPSSPLFFWQNMLKRQHTIWTHAQGLAFRKTICEDSKHFLKYSPQTCSVADKGLKQRDAGQRKPWVGPDLKVEGAVFFCFGTIPFSFLLEQTCQTRDVM